MFSISNFTFSSHALERMLDMDVQPDEVRRCLEFPRFINASDRGDDRSLYFGDRITCVVGADLQVVTVVWRTKKAWKADLASGGYGGREYREDVGA